MNLTVMTGPASDVSGEAFTGSVSLVLDEIADTAAGIEGQQVADLARHLSQPGRVFVAGESSGSGTPTSNNRGPSISIPAVVSTQFSTPTALPNRKKTPS
ncbi:hypothetical protein [Arthrobacter sp. NicSoilB8]|uniref:hypothetical protein n=1 Tax=Arthrobacter sp. NicSoilB8 TaxID=2830998 RepID=UPI001CC3B941|nr:hypothetical protein [Arthrobacter sp. NicSoilB8]